jgi:DeoR/GlpR family transcriptional regulator of sugar metabolism
MKSQIDLYPTERQQKTLSLLNQAGRVTVADLSQMFAVSEVTIRADLQSLAAQGLIVRTHGGAVLASSTPELSLTVRREQRVLEKERIGIAAAEWVEDGDSIFLDGSSTALMLARQLTQRRNLSVLTHNLAVAQAFIEAPDVAVIVTGGVLRQDTASMMGLEGLAVLRKYNIKTGFFGAHGLSFPEGLTDVSAGEAAVKQAVVALCRQVIAMIDATKWGRVGLASFARPEDSHRIITDQQAPTDLVEQARAFGAQVIQV